METNSADIRVGLIGYGYAGRTLHAPLIRAVPGLKLTVVGSSRSDVVQGEIPDVVVCAPTKVATHPDVDLVVVASPNESHFSLGSAAILAGKHLIIDKPFTVTLEEARCLAALAKESGRVLSVFHNRRWESEVLATKEIIASGALGEVCEYECRMDRFRPLVRQRWRENPGPGAGLFFDLGPHMIDLALHLFGLPTSIGASLAILRPGGQTDDWAHVQLNYKRMRATLHCSLLVAGGSPRSSLHGTLGSWMKFGADVQEKQLVNGMSPTDSGFGVDPDPGIFVDGSTGIRTPIPCPRGQQIRYYASIRDAISLQKAPPVTAIEAVAVMAILETCFQSSLQGMVLPLPLTATEFREYEGIEMAQV